MKKKKQTSRKLSQGLFMIAFLIIGGICGSFTGSYIADTLHGGSLGRALLTLAGFIVCVYAAIFLTMAIHETGHGLFGALTGYKLMSYRLGSFMWVRGEDDRFRFRRFSLAGTGGQCLMAPPQWREEGFPCVLYNLGGSLTNLIAAALFGLGAWLCGPGSLGWVIFLVLAVTGAGLGLMNGVPLRLMQVDNDGYNTLAVKRSRQARWAFWAQLKVSQMQARGVRLKDMPEEWFRLSEDADMKNSLISTIAVFNCNRVMDALEVERAGEMISALLSGSAEIAGLYHRLLTNDMIFCKLLAGDNPGAVQLLDKPQKKLAKAMKDYPSILRTEYAIALLEQRDDAKATKILARFDKIARTYPYPAEIESERQLIALAQEKAK